MKIMKLLLTIYSKLNFMKIFVKLYLALRNKKYFSINKLDEKIEKKHLNYDNGFYVEIGANNGINQSNTFFFELFRNWKGILIEPLELKFHECKKFRSNKSNKFFNYACVGFDYKKEYINILDLDLMSISDNSSFDNLQKKEHIKYGEKFLHTKDKIRSVKSKVTVLNEILIRSKAPLMIDFLSLDVEGAELDVLNGIDFNNYNFKNILVETKNFDEIHNFLIKKNYTFIETMSYHDYLFQYSFK